MKKEKLISALVMTIVSMLMLVGVTVAWYTASGSQPTVTGMNMSAADMGNIKIALEPGGKDIADLENDDDPDNEFVEIGLEELLNIVDNQMAPGAYGEVKFYVTSLNEETKSCQLVPSLIPEYEKEFAGKYPDGVPEDATVEINHQQKVIRKVLEEHFDFYSDEAMTDPVNFDKPMKIVLIDENNPWDSDKNTGAEIEVTLYWKWHYEDPEATAADTQMTPEEKTAAIYDYDMEDTWIGTHLDKIRFHFAFLLQ